MQRRSFLCALALLAAGAPQLPAQDAAPEPPKPPVGEWQPMFDGKTLAGWRESEFFRRGEVRVENGSIILGKGSMTGVTWTKWFPTSNYEVRYEARRLEGIDFFASVTFPVQDTFCSWIIGGWGGIVVGISNLNGMSASENETTLEMGFETGRWYALRFRVTDERIQAWIDEEMVINLNYKGQWLNLRAGDIEHSKPFGFAAYATTGELRKPEYRLLAASDAGN